MECEPSNLVYYLMNFREDGRMTKAEEEIVKKLLKGKEVG